MPATDLTTELPQKIRKLSLCSFLIFVFLNDYVFFGNTATREGFSLLQQCTGCLIAGICAGAVTGLFGAGGGMVLVPLLSMLTPLSDKEIFPSSISIIIPICLVSLFIGFQGVLWREAIPYLIGSGAGGFFAGKWGGKIPVKWLHRGLGILILWGGIRYLC